MASKPTQRSLAILKKECDGHVQVVEKWIAFAKKRIDLFGIIDIVALRGFRILGVQATSGSNHSSHVDKALASPHLKAWLEAEGEFEIWSFQKRGKRGQRKLWKRRITKFSVGTLTGLIRFTNEVDD